MASDLADILGFVVIGRNEGQRLRLCLESVLPLGCATVYADSGSTDGSAELARRMGAQVVELDASLPFTAARGRNAGFERLMELRPSVQFVQFIDGDCELLAGWPEAAIELLGRQSDVAIVTGMLIERRPEASIYNRLCQIEWSRPAGEATECGGIFVIRREAFEQVGGFDATVAAGEEPDLCLRLRQRGWRVLRLEARMATHDANMMRFGQWWRRAVRSGRGYADAVRRRGRNAPAGWRRQLVSIVLWTFALPLTVIVLSLLSSPWWLLLLLAYPLQVLRIRQRQIAAGIDGRTATAYAVFIMLGKFAQAVGSMLSAIRSRGGDAQATCGGQRDHTIARVVQE